MQEIILLTDYKNRFGSKHHDHPYRSGMDKDLLTRYFSETGYKTEFIPFPQAGGGGEKFRGRYVLYTSSEDPGARYKSFIEDVVYGLELAGAIPVPAYPFLRSHNNKVFMEILRRKIFPSHINNLPGKCFGTYEELKAHSRETGLPAVVKSWEGANSKAVYLARTEKELRKTGKKVSSTPDARKAAWETGRKWKHKGYARDSFHRSRFIVQPFIPGLKNDWKIYVFGNRYFIFYRPVLGKGNFRASGGGYENYLYGSQAPRPDGLLDFAETVFRHMDVPHASLDIAWDGRQFYLIEFQALYFGTAGILFSDCYFEKRDSNWEAIHKKTDIEGAYVHGIHHYINKIHH